MFQLKGGKFFLYFNFICSSALDYLQQHFNLKKKEPSSYDEMRGSFTHVTNMGVSPYQKTDVFFYNSISRLPLYIYAFPHTICCSSDKKHEGKPCGVAALLFSYSFKRDTSPFHPSHSDVSEQVHQQVIDAITNGNELYEKYLDRIHEFPNIKDILLMTDYLPVSIVNELEFESEHIETIADYVVSLRYHETLLVFLPEPDYRVLALYVCDEFSSVQMFDAGEHKIACCTPKPKTWGSFIMYGPRNYHSVINMLTCYSYNATKISGVCKFVVLEMNY